MKHLVSLALVILCFWLNIPAAKSEAAVIGASKARFFSPATANGERRFIAIGNFFDTTNEAYYFDSQGLLEFKLPADPNYLISNAKLQIYKYANAYPGNVNVSLYQANKLLGTKIATAADYDYQLLEFDLTETVKQNWGQSVEFDLKVDSAKAQEGIAVCSGKFQDSVCPERYAPRLNLDYQFNTLGLVEQHQRFGEAEANLSTHSPFVICQYLSGCKLEHQVKLQDKEGNLSFKLVYESSHGLVYSKSISYSSAPVNLSIELKDGSYKSWYELVDGGYQIKTELGRLEVNTSILPTYSWQSIKLAQDRLSPLNSDGNYDILRVEVQSERQIKELRSRLISTGNLFHELAVNWQQQGARIYIESSSIPDLEGDYLLELYGTDVNGYEIGTLNRPRLALDNQPPQLF